MYRSTQIKRVTIAKINLFFLIAIDSSTAACYTEFNHSEYPAKEKIPINTRYFYYLIEIERVNSLNRAAENLFIAQPNLSRILKDIEKDIGFTIFERHSDGVTPTERGNEYLKHVHRVIYELESAKQLQPSRDGLDRLRICIPRSANWFEHITDFLARNNALNHVDAAIHECHARRALEMMTKNTVGIGIIRVRKEYLPYFEKQLRASALHFMIISDLDFMVTTAVDHPFQTVGDIPLDLLRQYPEISHSDDYFLPDRRKAADAGKIYITDRLAQLDMLHTIPNAWMWAEPMNAHRLQNSRLIQLSCSTRENTYSDLLIFSDNNLLTTIESQLLQYLKTL